MQNNFESKEQRELIFNQALIRLSKQLNVVMKDSKNPHFRNKFASLNAHLDLIKPVAEKEGFIFSQRTTVINTAQGPRNTVVSEIVHVDTGLTRDASLYLPDIQDPQKLVAAITYYRRATANSLFALQAEDDDGNIAAGHAKVKTKKNVKNISQENDF